MPILPAEHEGARPLPLVPETVLVLDIGKTNAKAALVDGATLAELDVLTMPNRVLPGPPYPHADTEALWALHRRGRANDAGPARGRGDRGDGARRDGRAGRRRRRAGAAGPRLRASPARTRWRPTTTPSVPASRRPARRACPRGLTLGAQLFWQFRRFPDEAARARLDPDVSAILGHPPDRGRAPPSATSLGCHTDLWNPRAGTSRRWSTRMGWSALMPPLRRAADVLGPVTAGGGGGDRPRPGDAGALRHPRFQRLAPAAPAAPPAALRGGLHRHLGHRDGDRRPAGGARRRPRYADQRQRLRRPGAVGALHGRARVVAADGGPRRPEATAADAEAVLAHGIMLFPAVEPGSGPFAGRAHRWSVPEAEISDGQRAVAVAWYLALMTGVCLELIGAEGPVVVEGPFAGNAQFREMLAVLVPAGLAQAPAPRPAPVPAPHCWRCRPVRRCRRRRSSRHGTSARRGSPPTPGAGARRWRPAARGFAQGSGSEQRWGDW